MSRLASIGGGDGKCEREGYPLTYRLQASMSAVYLEESLAPGVILGLFLPWKGVASSP